MIWETTTSEVQLPYEEIYLVGQISPTFSETYKWREEVKKYFSDYPNFRIIDPCGNAFNQKLRLSDNNIGYIKKDGINVLVPKDRNFVKRSSIAIANMNQYDPNKPLIGTFFELAWYYDSPEKTVIGFADDMTNYLCQHPFVKSSITTWVKDHLRACDLILNYFIDDWK